ncbi:hypothetical protein G4B88_030234, partial [Cannabis sativa]
MGISFIVLASYHTKSYSSRKNTQNKGVVVKVEHNSSTCDYYGVLLEIIELYYSGDLRVVLFKSDRWDVNVLKELLLIHMDLLVDVKNLDRLVIVKIEPRDFYNIPIKEVDDDEHVVYEDMEPYQQKKSSAHPIFNMQNKDDDIVQP